MGTITLNVDNEFENLVKDLGLTVSSALNKLMQECVRKKRIDVDFEDNYISPEFREKIEKARKDYEEGKCYHINNVDDIDKLIEERRKCTM